MVKGKVIRYQADSRHEVPDACALEMIRCGYADKASEEVEAANSTLGDSSEREVFWRAFTKSDLQELCKKHIDSYRARIHRSIDSMIELILLHEAEHGSLLKNGNEQR